MVGLFFLNDDGEMIDDRSRSAVIERIFRLPQEPYRSIVLCNDTSEKGLFLVGRICLGSQSV